MIIVLIDWYIKPEKVDEFFSFWKENATISDRAGLIGEFLCEPADIKHLPWITWNMNACIDADSNVNDEAEYRRFVNVGLWMEEKSFEDAVAKYFNAGKKKEDFEHHERKRRRALLIPKAWRIGKGQLPGGDSGGVK